MRDALQRAAVFLGYAVNAAEGTPLSSVRLKAPIELSVGVPDPIPEEQRPAYQQQFRNWVIGQALIELDQNYQRFVVSSIETIADLEHFKTHRTLCLVHKPNLANTWTVHEQFHSPAGHTDQSHLDESRYLRSLGNARNCLAHDSGLVTERRLTDGDTMPIRWPGQDIYQTLHSGERQLLQREHPFEVRQEDIGTTLSAEAVVREKIYRAGDTILFSSTDLSEIIFFYQILAMRIGAELHRLVEEAGRELNA
ncbi:hypothetical protein LKMONMHP_2556 [Methylobacterium organophilum]|uniref:MAE-28990/MAE-18760-like HEPN domain-containing protein n=2 Tax=Methylobacterium organophilum TaxID=410 RepID=A0ABQ4T9Y3_METOR|nr:hypothetical protein LKMONMHP_2556 [Methylobacterium organophilum]